MAMPYADLGTPYADTGAGYLDQAVATEITNDLLHETLTIPSAFQDAGQPYSFGQNVATEETWRDDLLVTSTSLYDEEPQVDNPRKRQRADDPIAAPSDPPLDLSPEMWFTNWAPPVASCKEWEGSMQNEAEPSRGRGTSKIVPSRSGSVSSFASNVSCRSCSATFARPDVRKRHEDEKHLLTARKVTCGGAWLGWGCGRGEYANDRSLKDHWSRQAKDGTGKSCKAAKEAIFASFPPKDNLVEQSSTQDGIMWDERESIIDRSTKESISLQDWPPITPAQSSALLCTGVQPEQAITSNLGPPLTDIQAADRPSFGSSDLDVAMIKLCRAIPSLKSVPAIASVSFLTIVRHAVAHIECIEADRAALKERLTRKSVLRHRSSTTKS